jgi:ABC-type taurine transport system substrate-binding protein
MSTLLKLRYALALVALATAAAAHALTIDYDIARIPELRACDDHEYHGRAEVAIEWYSRKPPKDCVT